jgi:adenylate cyclase
MIEKLHVWLSGITERRIIIIAAILLFLPSLMPGGCASAEDVTLKTALKFSKTTGEKPSVAIVAIDARTIEEINPPSMLPSAVVKAIDNLDLLNARLIVVDEHVKGEKVDLVSQISPSRFKTKIIRGYEFYPHLSNLPPDYAKSAGESAAAEATEFALPSTLSDNYHLKTMAGIELDAIRGAMKRRAGDGFSNIFPDPDGVIRRSPLALRFGKRAYPSLPLASAAEALDLTPLIIEDASGSPEGIALGDRKIKTSADTNVAIGFKEPQFFPHISLSDMASGKVDADAIAGMIALIGFTDPEFAQIFDTPVGKMPSVAIFANSLQSILEFKRIVLLTDMKWTALALAAALAAFAFIVLRLRLYMRMVFTAVAIALTWIFTIVFFRFTGTLLPAAHFSIYAGIFLLLSVGWQLFVIEVPRRFRIRTFQMRIVPDQLEKAFRTTGALSSQGAVRSVTAAAFDIRGYGSIACKTPAERLCSLMREYRTITTRILLKYGAFIDSWAGDECRAAFGAILPDKEQHLAACIAALEIQRTFSKEREEISKRYGVDRLNLRIGIAAGSSVVGSLGPRGLADINVTGAAMETACTLRGLNQTYHTAIIVDDAVKAEVQSHLSFRPLDLILLVGNEKPVVIHELLGKTGVILPQLELYQKAREAYLKGEFETAVHLFSELLAKHPHDGPSYLLLRRARMLIANPPKGEWKGVWTAQL